MTTRVVKKTPKTTTFFAKKTPFAGMAASIPDIDDLSGDDLKKLVLRLPDEMSALKAENAAPREEIAGLTRS